MNQREMAIKGEKINNSYKMFKNFREDGNCS